MTLDTVVQEAWSRVRERVRDDIGDRLFEMWFERSCVLSLRRGVLSIGVPNLFIREWVEEHFGGVVAKAAADEIGAPVRIAVKVDPTLFREMRKETERIEAVSDDAPSAEGKDLQSFVLTEGNRMAVDAIRHVSRRDRPAMNPLVIYGPDGSGKTHLASAASRIFPPGTQVYRVTGEEFARRFAWNLKTRRIERFREQVSGAGLVILDDAELLAGKSATQRELANLIKDLEARGGQLIAFLEKHPNQVADFEDVLRSVFLGGMLVSLDPPGPEDAIRIVEGLLSSTRRRIPPQMVRSIADRCGGSVKRLDRLVRKVYAFAGLTGEPVDERFLDRHLEEIAGPSDPRERRLETIFSVVEDHFDVTRAEIVSKKKTKSLSAPRGLVVFLLREHAGQTFKEIGRRMGDRSHTSVFLMYRKYAEIITQDLELSAVAKEAGRRLIMAG